MAHPHALRETEPPAPFSELLPRLQDDLGRHFSVATVRLGPFAYEDRRFSHLLRAQVSFNGRPSGTPVYVKIYKAGTAAGEFEKIHARVQHDFVSTRRVFEHMSRWPDLTSVRPIACYPDHLAIATEEARGETLLALLEHSARGYPGRESLKQACETMSRVGAWLSAFQMLERIEERAPMSVFRDYVDVRLHKLVRAPAARFNEEDRRRVLDHIDCLSALGGEHGLRQVAVHGDLALANVLVDGKRIVVLDFAMAGRGTVFHDLARVFVQIDLLRTKPQFRPATIASLQRALLAGFDPALRQEDPLFRLALLRHHVNHLATLSVRHERFPASIYNWLVRRRHRRWIAQELSSTPSTMAALA